MTKHFVTLSFATNKQDWETVVSHHSQHEYDSYEAKISNKMCNNPTLHYMNGKQTKHDHSYKYTRVPLMQWCYLNVIIQNTKLIIQ